MGFKKDKVRWVFGASLLALACSSDGDSGEAVSKFPAADGIAGGPPFNVALDGQCVRMRTYVAGSLRYLDAYTTHDGAVVTRPFQSNDTQSWCFTRVRDEISGIAGGPSFLGTWYTIQHRSFTGQYLDAYVNTSGQRAVLRDAQTDHTQEWFVTNGSGTIKQGGVSSYRTLFALSTSEDDFGVVTRSDVGSTWTLGNYTR